MKKVWICIYWMLIGSSVYSQIIIKGTVFSDENRVISGANIYLKGTLDGTTTNETGTFEFTTHITGSGIIVVSFMGYRTQEIPVILDLKVIELHIILIPENIELSDVTITAGQFEAGDKKKSVVLNRLDLATSPGSFGDALGAVMTLPGISNPANEGGLMVRGGEKYETKTFIDGLLVESPYTAKLPNVPVRGRFSPMLFKETVFSSGGYSAEFGQALSSGLILNSIDFFEKDELNATFFLSGLNFNGIKTSKHRGISVTSQYHNMNPLFTLMHSNIQWLKTPEGFNQTIALRQKIGETGNLKVMTNVSFDRSGLLSYNIDKGNNDQIHLTNTNIFIASTYKTEMGNGWLYYSGVTFSSDSEPVQFNNDKITTVKNAGELKVKFSKAFTHNLNFKMGGAMGFKHYEREYFPEISNQTYKWQFKNIQPSFFTEIDMKITPRIATRFGLRGEIQSLAKETALSPRISVAFKTSASGQISAAFGHYSQLAADEYLVYNKHLSSEQAVHYILSYQYIKNKRIFRIEGYYKKYTDLVKYDSLYAIQTQAYNNAGYGFAKGVDVFYRDNASVRNGSFWISYSFMDSKRNYKDYSYSRTPWFVANHNLYMVYKHYFSTIDSYISLGYDFSSGRPYINPNISVNLQQYSRNYNSLNINIFHFTQIFGKFTMLFGQVTNVFGASNVFGYRYANNPDTNGIYPSLPILPLTKRFFLAGIHVSFTGKPDL